MTACGTVVVLLYVSLFFAAVRTQQVAPGDEDQVCTGAESVNASDLPDIDQEILMASYNYADLLETNGGPWISVAQNNEDELGVSSPRALSRLIGTAWAAIACMHACVCIGRGIGIRPRASAR